MDYNELPVNLRGGIQSYIERGMGVGGFLTAVLENDLAKAVERGGGDNRKRLADIVIWLYNNAPRVAWGSVASVEAWEAKGGLKGIDRVWPPVLTGWQRTHDLTHDGSNKACEWCAPSRLG